MKVKYEMIVYSVLENGHRIIGRLPLGSMFMTQWGERRVISHSVETINCADLIDGPAYA